MFPEAPDLFRPTARVSRLLLPLLPSRKARDGRNSRVGDVVCLRPTAASIDAPLLTWCRIYFPPHGSATDVWLCGLSVLADTASSVCLHRQQRQHRRFNL